MKKWIFAAVGLFLFASSAAGQTMCTDLKNVDNEMAKIGAATVAFGSVDKDRIIMIYAMKDGEWIIYIVDKHARACVLGSGAHWSMANAPSL